MGDIIRRACAVAAVSMVSFGCFTREETIEVHEDGSASITYQVEGGEAELGSADALPGQAGWQSTREEETGQGGERSVKITWRANLEDLNAYPHTFAAPGDRRREAYLETHTSLGVEREGGRTIYRFERRYVGRRSGKFLQAQELALPGELLEKAENEEAQLTPEEREDLFEGLARYEAMVMLFQARDALGRAVELDLIDAASFEIAGRRLAEFLEQRLTSTSLQRLFRLTSEAQEAEAERLRNDLRAEAESMLPARVRERVLDLLDLEEKRFDVTEDLGNDLFSLKVVLPGIVVSSNSLEAEGGSVTWEFDGEDLSEGDLVLSAVSVLDQSTDGR